jgi:hypothetical protein
MKGYEARIEVGDTTENPVHQGFYTLTLDATDGYRLSLSDQVLVSTDIEPGIYTYHAAGNYKLSAVDMDQDEHISSCSVVYGSPWWYGECWDGSLWGWGETFQQNQYSSQAYWATTSSLQYNWGAIWLR